MTAVYGVYGIFMPENYVYIGSTIADISVRFRVHKHALEKGTHDNDKLQELWDKYHTADFVILEDMAGKTEPEVREMEQHLIEQMQVEYKMCNEAPAMLEGYALSATIKEKISKGRREGKTGGKKRINSFKPIEDSNITETHKKNLELRKEQGW
jgi:hypothetical protein